MGTHGDIVGSARERELSPLPGETVVRVVTVRERFLKTIWLVIVINLFALVFGAVVEESLKKQKEIYLWQLK